MGLTNYIKETKAELKHVNWPNREQTIQLTILVIAISILVGVLLGFFDVIFTSILTRLIA